jgi:glycosyltransferase involved in cell wall biosynthesis
MKIGIVAPSSVPFTLGGAERLWNGLVRELNEGTPHDAELIKLPTREHNLPDLVESYRAFSRLDLSHLDLVITTKYPAWMVPHPNHVVYLQHVLRGLYDTYHFTGLPERVTFDDPDLRHLQDLMRNEPRRDRLGEFFDCFASLVTNRAPGDPAFAFPGPLAREIVHFLDGIGLSPGSVRRYLSISRTVASRPFYFPPGAVVEAVHHPSDLTGYQGRGFEYFFTASRLDGAKRIGLLVEAMQFVPGPIRLKIAGSGPDLERLRHLAGGDPRIEFLGYVPSEDLLGLYADALAVPFVPLDEDLGLITIEAMSSGKPVVTCHDSGGPTELVVDGENGYIVEPSPQALGRALARLAGNPSLAERLGDAGRHRVARVTWKQTLGALLRTHDRPPAPPPRLPGPRGSRRSRPRLTVVSTFVTNPPTGGGQLRCFHLYGSLSPAFDLELVSLGPYGSEPSRLEIRPGFIETVVPKSLEHQQREIAVTDAAGVPLTDILAGPLIRWTPAYLDALANALRGASAVLLAHPFLHPAVRLLDQDVPVVYDAHNAEFQLKSSILPATETGRWLQALVHRTEEEAAREAVLVSACSSQDADMLCAEFGIEPVRLAVIENGIDLDLAPFVEYDRRARKSQAWRDRFAGRGPMPRPPEHTALFLASWHPPNLEAAERIISLAPDLPEVVFLMVGGHGKHFQSRLLPANVVLVGMVSNRQKQTLLESADIALNPILSGSGTNLKLVEYFAAGIPVISTPLGARGLHVESSVHLAISDIERFPAGIRSLLANEAEAEEMARQARGLVEEGYDWKVLGRRLRNRIELALSGGPPAPAGGRREPLVVSS